MLDGVRAAIDRTASEQGIALVPTEGSWIVRGVPLAPFPARLRIDERQGLLWHDVVAAEVVPPVSLAAVVEGIALPRPEVRLMVAEARRLVAISYPLALDAVRPSEVAGLLAAGPLYAAQLTVALAAHLGKRWRTMLQEHGFTADHGLPNDPRDLLRSGHVVPWPDLGV